MILLNFEFDLHNKTDFPNFYLNINYCSSPRRKWKSHNSWEYVLFYSLIIYLLFQCWFYENIFWGSKRMKMKTHWKCVWGWVMLIITIHDISTRHICPCVSCMPTSKSWVFIYLGEVEGTFGHFLINDFYI